MDVLRINWKAIDYYCALIADKIRLSKFSPEIAIAVSRGGLIPGRLLVDQLGIRSLLVIGVSLYSGIGKRAKEPEITQDITTNLKDKSILLVDDVADSGQTLIFLKNLFLARGAKEVRVATIHHKPSSSLEPDYFAATSDAWIAYPWERNEIEKEIKQQA